MSPSPQPFYPAYPHFFEALNRECDSTRLTFYRFLDQSENGFGCWGLQPKDYLLSEMDARLADMSKALLSFEHREPGALGRLYMILWNIVNELSNLPEAFRDTDADPLPVLFSFLDDTVEYSELDATEWRRDILIDLVRQELANIAQRQEFWAFGDLGWRLLSPFEARCRVLWSEKLHVYFRHLPDTDIVVPEARLFDMRAGPPQHMQRNPRIDLNMEEVAYVTALAKEVGADICFWEVPLRNGEVRPYLQPLTLSISTPLCSGVDEPARNTVDAVDAVDEQTVIIHQDNPTTTSTSTPDVKEEQHVDTTCGVECAPEVKSEFDRKLDRLNMACSWLGKFEYDCEPVVEIRLPLRRDSESSATTWSYSGSTVSIASSRGGDSAVTTEEDSGSEPPYSERLPENGAR